MLAEWVSAISNIVMAGVGVAAAFYAYGQWQETKKQQLHAAEDSALWLAAGLNACWVLKAEKRSPHQWGVIVDDSFDSAFYEVSVECVSIVHCKSLELKVIPPGTYFFESKSANQGGWEYASVVADQACHRLLLQAASHRIDRLSFTDSAAQRWEMRPETGLRDIPAEQSAN